MDRVAPIGQVLELSAFSAVKGPGLDFVYRWQAWETCQKAVSQLHTSDPLVAEQGLRALVAFQEYGLLCEEYVQETLEIVRHMPLAQNERFQAELTVILSNLATSIQQVKAHMHVIRSTGWVAK